MLSEALCCSLWTARRPRWFVCLLAWLVRSMVFVCACWWLGLEKKRLRLVYPSLVGDEERREREGKSRWSRSKRRTRKERQARLWPNWMEFTCFRLDSKLGQGGGGGRPLSSHRHRRALNSCSLMKLAWWWWWWWWSVEGRQVNNKKRECTWLREHWQHGFRSRRRGGGGGGGSDVSKVARLERESLVVSRRFQYCVC